MATLMYIHNVQSLEVSDLIRYEGSKWRTIEITTNEVNLTINLFPAENDIEVKSPAPKYIGFGKNCYYIQVGKKEYYYSYNTCVAYWDNTHAVRIQSPSKTTSRHMSAMGVTNFTVIENDEFAKLIS